MARRPLVSVVLAYICGTLLYVFAPSLVLAPLVGLVPALLFFALRPRSLYGLVAVCLAATSLGFWRMSLANYIPANAISAFAPAAISVTGVLSSDIDIVEVKGRSQKRRLQFRMEAESVRTKAFESQQSVRGTLQVYAYQTQDSASAPPAYGSRVRLLGDLEKPAGQRNPGGFNSEQYLKGQGIRAIFTARRWETLPESHGGNPVLGAIFALRTRLIASSRVHLSSEYAGVLNGILFGERAEISGTLRDDFERTGTIHILATAGLHVGIAAGLLFALFRGCRLSRRKTILLTLGGLILYAFLAEGRPAVIRAVVIASVYLFARIAEREPDWWNAAAFAALILLILNPYFLMEAGFQLSFATVITLILFMPFCQARIRKLAERIPEDTLLKRAFRKSVAYLLTCFAVSCVAQAGTLPLIAVYFNVISLTSVFANLMVVPLAAPILALGFASAFSGAVHPILAVPIVEMLKVLLKAVIFFVQFWGGMSGGVVNAPSPSAWIVFIYYGILWSVGWRLYRKREKEEIV